MNAFEIKIPPERLRVMQIIGAAIPGGALMFAGITMIQHPPVPPFNLELDILVLVFLAQLVILVPLAFIIPRIVMSSTAKEAFKNVNLSAEIEQESLNNAAPQQTNKFLDIYQTQMIIGDALVEGVAIFGLVIYFVDQSFIGLIVAAVLIVLLLFRIPTLTGVQNCLANLIAEHEIVGERKI